MKHNFYKIILAMAVAWVPASLANAQPQGGPRPEFKGERRPMPTVNEMAQQRTNAMDHELTLTEKQYKKILKYYKAEVEKEREMMEFGRPEGMPEGFPGGGPGMGGGRPPMGGQGPQGGGFPGGGPGMGGGFPGGGPGVGGPGMGGFPGGGPGMGGPGMAMSDEEIEKYYEKQDKKLKKILTAEQYEKWRSRHPMKHIELPEIKFE